MAPNSSAVLNGLPTSVRTCIWLFQVRRGTGESGWDGSLSNSDRGPSRPSIVVADDMKAVQEVPSDITTTRSQVCLSVMSTSHAMGSDTGLPPSPGQGGQEGKEQLSLMLYSSPLNCREGPPWKVGDLIPGYQYNAILHHKKE